MHSTFHPVCGGTGGIRFPHLHIQEDSWGSLCSRPRAFDATLLLLEVFSTVHLSYFLCFLLLWQAFFLNITPIIPSLPQVLTCVRSYRRLGIWSHAYHLQLNFSCFCSQKPLAIPATGQLHNSRQGGGPRGLFLVLLLQCLLLFSDELCFRAPQIPVLFLCRTVLLPLSYSCLIQGVPPRTLSTTDMAHQDSASPQRLFFKMNSAASY